MTRRLRTATLAVVAGGALGVLGLLFGASSASAAPVGIDLDATTGSTALPGRATAVPVWGYCRRTDAATPCGPVSAPGGPTLVVTAGDVVTITLHNRLAEASSLQVGGQAMVPDVTGAPANGTKAYTFTASRPGTYLYQAGLTPNSQHQVAMGLYGALVVRPTTAGQAYDASTAYDAESVLVLSEVDPALNDASDPAAFDMRGFRPRWSLVNGKAHPATTPVAAASGQKLLLRWLNAGTFYHSMGVLGADQRVVALDGSQLRNGVTDLSRRYVAETFGPGQTADAIVTVPTTPSDRRLAVYDTSLTLHNSTAPGVGGMLTYIAVTGAGGGTDTSGPATTGVAWAAGTLDATVSDAATGAATVQGAEYYLDSIAAAPVAMTAVTAPFDTATEAVRATVPIVAGQHVLYVRGRDSLGNWGPFSSVLVMGADNQGPTTSAVAVAPDRTNGSVAVKVSATGDDSASGNSAIAGGEWSIDGGAATPLPTVTSGPVASLEGTISVPTVGALTAGTHSVAVRTRDSQGNWGLPATAQLVIDKQGPAATAVIVTPNPNDGTQPVNGTTSAVRLSATLTDAGSVSTVVKAEASIDTFDATKPGIPMEAADGAFSTPTENVYVDIPLATVRQMTDGPHTLYVRGLDSAGNWGPVGSTVLTVNKTRPLWFSTLGNTNPPGVAGTADNADIYTWSGTAFSRTIDMSELTRPVPLAANVDGFSRVSATSFYVSFTGTVNLPRPGGALTVQDEDVALWNGTTWSLYFDGTARNLGASDVDAISVVGGSLYYSTSDDTVPTGAGGTGDDADIYRWTSGTNSTRELTGTTVLGMALASQTPNVDGFVWRSSTDYLLSFSTDTTITGLGTTQDEDVVRRTGAAWSVYFDGTAHGLTTANLDVDAFDIP